jgi:haloalkane dehalogenase
MDRLRTPDARFNGLPDFSFSPHYADVGDPTGGDPLRVAYLDEGPREATETVVLLHGEPSWSFLYRKLVPILAGAGHRVVVPDLVGFGRSDKPTPRGEYTYARHVEWMRELLFDVLSLSSVTLFGQDWGSLIGLRLVGEHPERFARVAIGNGGLPTGDGRVSAAFTSWQEFSQSVPELPVGRIVAGGCAHPVADEVVAAYDAPFPDESYKEGARVFPLLVPTSPQDPAHDANAAAWTTLRSWKRPFLTCFSDGDPITRGADRAFREAVPGALDVAPVTIEGGGHFLQEDCGEQLARVLNEFIEATTSP